MGKQEEETSIDISALNGHAAAPVEVRRLGLVAKCQETADGGTDWFVPRTRFRLWLSTQMWKILPYTPWKNMMIEVPLKIGNSIHLRDYRQK